MSRCRRVGLLMLALAGWAGTPALRAADLPPDLAYVPANALAFAHLRVGDLIQGEPFKDLRAMVNRAGPEALEIYRKRFHPDPSTLDTITAFVIPQGDFRRPPFVGVLITTRTPFDAERVRQFLVPNPKMGGAGPTAHFVNPAQGLALKLLSDRQILISPWDNMEGVLGAIRPQAGALTPALEQARTKLLTVGVNTTNVPAEMLRDAPPPLKPFLKAQTMFASLEAGAKTRLDVQMRFTGPQDAKEADAALRELAKFGLQGLQQGRSEMMKVLQGGERPATMDDMPLATMALVGLASLNDYEAILKNPPVAIEGNNLTMTVEMPAVNSMNAMATSGIVAGLLLPGVQKVREAAGRTQDANNLKQIALAMHNHESALGTFPAHAIYAKDGKTPLLSWRVAILPFIEQDALFRQFKLDEPWDSEHNRKLIPMIPKVYVHPSLPPNAEGKTVYQVFVGGGAPWKLGPRGPRMVEITDGTSNTLMAVESANPVVWTKPEDLTYDPKKPVPKLGGFHVGGFNAGFMDGSVRFLRDSIAEATLRAMITAAGGEVYSYD